MADGMEVRLTSIERILERQDGKLSSIEEALTALAVQKRDIQEHERKLVALEAKLDALTDPKGTISEMKNFQASCPRNNIKWVWMAVVPLGLTELAMAFAIFKMSVGAP